MKIKNYVKKAAIFINEAIIDLLNGCYLKAVSALWFSIESLLRCITWFYSGKLYESTRKLIHEFGRSIIKKYLKHYTWLPSMLNQLHVLRINVDHKHVVYNKDDVKKILFIYFKVMDAILKISKSIGFDVSYVETNYNKLRQIKM